MIIILAIVVMLDAAAIVLGLAISWLIQRRTNTTPNRLEDEG